MGGSIRKMFFGNSKDTNKLLILLGIVLLIVIMYFFFFGGRSNLNQVFQINYAIWASMSYIYNAASDMQTVAYIVNRNLSTSTVIPSVALDSSKAATALTMPLKFYSADGLSYSYYSFGSLPTASTIISATANNTPATGVTMTGGITNNRLYIISTSGSNAYLYINGCWQSTTWSAVVSNGKLNNTLGITYNAAGITLGICTIAGIICFTQQLQPGFYLYKNPVCSSFALIGSTGAWIYGSSQADAVLASNSTTFQNDNAFQVATGAASQQPANSVITDTYSVQNNESTSIKLSFTTGKSGVSPPITVATATQYILPADVTTVEIQDINGAILNNANITYNSNTGTLPASSTYNNGTLTVPSLPLASTYSAAPAAGKVVSV